MDFMPRSRTEFYIGGQWVAPIGNANTAVENTVDRAGDRHRPDRWCRRRRPRGGRGPGGLRPVGRPSPPPAPTTSTGCSPP